MTLGGTETILIVDDDQARLDLLVGATERALEGSVFPVSVERWRPVGGQDPYETFREKTREVPVLVASDIELTGAGLTGLFGSSVVAWCRQRAIPVCGYTQRIDGLLSRHPDLFEFRIDIDPEVAGPQMAGIASGFLSMRAAIGELRPGPEAIRSPTELIAALLGRRGQAASFSLYASRIASSNAAIVDVIRRGAVSDALREELVAYVCGHLLVNGILRFPGPIASLEALCAYLALPKAAGEQVAAIFDVARYGGPFASLDRFYWVDDVDDIIDDLASAQGREPSDPPDRYRRAVVEAHAGADLGRHDCERCQGARGGFWCPFERRPVCDRPDCSVTSSNLVPQGAGLTRVERDFYEQWAPLLGL